MSWATSVLGILRIEQGHEWTGIDEGHRRGFRRNAICIPCRVSVEEAIA
jgi:hypothetical protein